LPYGQNELETVGLTTAPSSVVKPPRIAKVPASLECTEWGTLQIGENRLIIGLVKRVHVREELIDHGTLRIRDERFHVIGGMACLSPASIEYARVPEIVTRGLGRHDVGAYRLSRLAVSVAIQGQGMGGLLLPAADKLSG
jgi:Flavin reductase like domain